MLCACAPLLALGSGKVKTETALNVSLPRLLVTTRPVSPGTGIPWGRARAGDTDGQHFIPLPSLHTRDRATEITGGLFSAIQSFARLVGSLSPQSRPTVDSIPAC